MIYVAAPPSRRWAQLPLLRGQLHSDFLPETPVWEAEDNFLLFFGQEKPDKHHRSRVISVHVIGDVDSKCPQYNVMEMKFCLCGHPSQIP